LALLVAGGPAVAVGQSPGHAIPDALRSLTHGFGGCFADGPISRVEIEFWPTVEFFRTECVLEHGDSASAIVGIDSDSVLYLLASDEAFKFLMDRHPTVAIDSGNFLPFIRTALELTGRIPSQARLLRAWSDLPDSVVSRIKPQGRVLWYGQRAKVWTGTVYTASAGYYGDFVTSHEIVLLPGGRLVSTDSLVYRPSGHP
jgi:hypothetical protein